MRYYNANYKFSNKEHKQYKIQQNQIKINTAQEESYQTLLLIKFYETSL